MWLEEGRPNEEEEGGGGRGGPGERQSDGLSRSRDELLHPSSAWISEPPLDRFPLPWTGRKDEDARRSLMILLGRFLNHTQVCLRRSKRA